MPEAHPGLYRRISLTRLASDLGIPESRVSEIVRGVRGVTADTALRLARYFGTSHELWLNLQDRYDIEEIQRAKHREIEKIRPYAAVA